MFSRRYCTHSVTAAGQLVTALATLAAFAASAAAADPLVSGNYKAWLLEQPDIHKRSAYREALRDGSIGDAAAFDLVVTYKLSELTREQNLFHLPKLRRQLRYDLAVAGRAPAAAAHDRLITLALDHLPAVVDDRAYHVGTRYNALLLIGELNRVEERPFAPAAAAQPLAESLPLLVVWLEAGVGGAERDFLALGAILGILRHAQHGIDDEGLRQRTLQAAVTLCGQSQPPQERSAAGHDWLRRRALQVLAWTVRPGGTPLDDRAVELIWETIDDPSASLALQIEGALAWSLVSGKLPQGNLDAADALGKLAALAGRIVRSELHTVARPAFASRQSRRVVAGHLGQLSQACRQLGVDVIALRRSGPPSELVELADLYCGLKDWIAAASNPQLASRHAADTLAGALTLLDRQPAAPAKDP